MRTSWALALPLLLFILGDALNAEARCASSGLWAWPEQRLPQTGLIIITAFARSQAELEPRRDRGARLVSKERTVRLNRVELLRGQYGLSQLVLRPDSPLRVGTRYALFLGDTALGKYEVTAAEHVPPEWAAPPLLVGQQAAQLGCGPSNSTTVRTEIVDASAVTVRVELFDLEAKTSARFYLHPAAGRIELGHGMCSGAFAPEPGRRYQARFVAMDAGGLEVQAPSALEFVAPGP